MAWQKIKRGVSERCQMDGPEQSPPRAAAGTPQSRRWQRRCRRRWSRRAARCLLLICGLTASWQGPAPAAAPAPGAPRALPGALQSRRDAGCEGQRAGGIAGCRPPAAQERRVKAALSPSLHQAHLRNKFLDLVSSRSAGIKPSSFSPGWSSSLSPAHRLHLLRGHETSPSRQPKEQPQLRRCGSMKHGPSRGCPITTEWVPGMDLPFPGTPSQCATTAMANTDPVPRRRTRQGGGKRARPTSHIACRLGKKEADLGCPCDQVPTSQYLLMPTYPPG